MMMNNLHCSGVSESGAVAEMVVFGLVFLSLVSSLTFDEDAVGVNVLLGVVPDFSMGLSFFSRGGERFRLLLSWLLSLSGFLLLPLFVMLFSERDVVVVVVAGGGDRRLEDSDRFDFVSEDRFLNRLLGGGVRERDVDLDLE